MVTHPQASFWHGRRVVVTGHTGFKGGWLSLWLARMGAEVTGIALPPETTPSLFDLVRLPEHVKSHFADVREATAIAALIRAAQPEIVLHLAAQPLVRRSYRQPLETFGSNVMGTAHVLDALRDLPGVKAAVIITTDKVYRNVETIFPYREDDALGGHDPYSASKAAAELVTASYRDAFLSAQGVAVATARAGNVIGGGDWSEDRLIPDAVRAWGEGRTLDIRRPDAVRPWQHVLEPLSAYLCLAEHLVQNPSLAGAYNFGPRTDEAATVRDVVELARKVFGRGEAVFAESPQGPHEAGLLALEIARAREVLGVAPRWNLVEGVTRTMNWYRGWLDGADVRGLCEADIAAFEEAS